MVYCGRARRGRSARGRENSAVTRGAAGRLSFSQGRRRSLRHLEKLELLSSSFVRGMFRSGTYARFLLRVVLGEASLGMLQIGKRRSVGGLRKHSMELSVLTISTGGEICGVRVREDSGNTKIGETECGDDLVSTGIARPNRGCRGLYRSCIVFVARGSVVGTKLPVCRVSEAMGRANRLFNSRSRVVCIGSRVGSRSTLKVLVRSFSYASTGSVGCGVLTSQIQCFGRSRGKITAVYGTVRRVQGRRLVRMTRHLLGLGGLSCRRVTRVTGLAMRRIGTLSRGRVT